MSTSDNEKKISYFNTLIFTIITGIVSLAILGLLFFEFGRTFIYFIIAFEIGVFILIAYCIYKIVSGSRKSDKNKDSYVLRFNECPDYFTRREAKDGTVSCVNKYIVKDRNGQIYLSAITPTQFNGEEVTIPASAQPDTSTPASYEKVILRQLEKDDKFSKYQDKCNLIWNAPKATDAHAAPYSGYSAIPWTYMRSRCESYMA
jgi:hypothetical protein